jgi:hypothetical protein
MANFNHTESTLVDPPLTSLPEGFCSSFPKVTSIGDEFMCQFTYYGKYLHSLPDGFCGPDAFPELTTVNDYFMWGFNENAFLTSLSDGMCSSFPSLTTVGKEWMYYFNIGSYLTSLPEGFCGYNAFPELRTVGADWMGHFNNMGDIVSLPEGFCSSFPKLTTIGDNWMSGFNNQIGALKRVTGTTSTNVLVPSNYTHGSVSFMYAGTDNDSTYGYQSVQPGNVMKYKQGHS